MERARGARQAPRFQPHWTTALSRGNLKRSTMIFSGERRPRSTCVYVCRLAAFELRHGPPAQGQGRTGWEGTQEPREPGPPTRVGISCGLRRRYMGGYGRGWVWQRMGHRHRGVGGCGQLCTSSATGGAAGGGGVRHRAADARGSGPGAAARAPRHPGEAATLLACRGWWEAPHTSDQRPGDPRRLSSTPKRWKTTCRGSGRAWRRPSSFRKWCCWQPRQRPSRSGRPGPRRPRATCPW